MTPLKSGTIMKENLCFPCCRSLGSDPRYSHTWEMFVKSSALDNLKKHINKIHPGLMIEETSIQHEVSKKQSKYNGADSMSMVNFIKPSLKQHKVDITRWFYLDGIPFNISTSHAFWAIHKKHYDNYTALSRDKFNNKFAHYY